MKTPALLPVSFLLVIASVTTASGWGDNGHKTVGQIASLRVNSHTAQRLAQIMKSGETLASVATWADQVKNRVGEHDPDVDTEAFLQDELHNKLNSEWHFVDLPLGCSAYQACTGFTLDNDIVHLINICIRTLQGHPDPNQPLSERNALRLLVHFLGDIHQPLHVGTGFIDRTGPHNLPRIATDPALISQKHLVSDRGGNQLIIDNDRKRLHSFWDSDLVNSLMGITHKQTPAELGLFLKQTVSPKSDWVAHGALNTWAAQWATDSLGLARNNAYQSVHIRRQRTIPVLRNGEPLIRDGKPVTEIVYDITRAGNYESLNRGVVKEQLAKAGFRLAKLLDAIYAQ